MSHRCQLCSSIMTPTTTRHECSNHRCRTTLEVPLLADSVPRINGVLEISREDIKHTLLCLQNVDRKSSALQSGVSHRAHARALVSMARKLLCYQQFLTGQSNNEDLSEGERKRLEITQRFQDGEINEAKAAVLLTELSEQEAQEE